MTSPKQGAGQPPAIDDPAGIAAYLRLSVDNELHRLNRDRGEDNAPFGGWRNTAINTIADREGMNPYTLDRIIRGTSDD